MKSAFLVVLGACSLPGQSFDVASVRRAADNKILGGEPSDFITISGNTLTARAASLKDMIRFAWSLRDHQVAGPGWIASDRYDVMAKAPPNVAATDYPRLLQALLAERFRLETRRETRDLSVTEMVPARGGVKLGPPKAEAPASISTDGGRLVFRNYPMPRLASWLSRLNRTPIVDATHIDGCFDFSVPIDAASPDAVDMKRAVETAFADGSAARAVVAAIGLRLESRKSPVEILVVERADRIPAEN